ncbi:MAG: AMP-binding protein, partial [Natronospirillum sp.]
MTEYFIGQHLAYWASRTATHQAIICEHRSLSWQALHEQVHHLAHWLVAQTGSGRAIGLDLPDPQDLIVAFFAVARAGSRALVFDAAWSAAQ